MIFKIVRVDSQVYDKLTEERKQKGYYAMNDVLRQVLDMPKWEGQRRGKYKRKKKKTT